jgi:hypothetical protein
MNLHWVLHKGFGIHSKAPKIHIDYFEMTLHMSIVLRVKFLFKVN